MAADRQTLCLNMIVKNEAPVITRCLASVRPLIDYWVIVDTGSTDGTQDKIRAFMTDLPGKLHERPWRDFAHNRTEALELARPHGEYVLIIDADDVLEFEPQFKMPVLQAELVHASDRRHLRQLRQDADRQGGPAMEMAGRTARIPDLRRGPHQQLARRPATPTPS